MSTVATKLINSKTRQAWEDNWAGRSVKTVLEIFTYPRVQRLVKTYTQVLPKKGKILEGGCGLGPWLIKLKELGYDMVGIDYDCRSISRIKMYDKSLPVFVADINNIPFPDDYFSAYISLGVLEHFYEGPTKAIREARRVLRSGGIFLVVVPFMNMLMRLKRPLEKLKKNNTLRSILGKKEKAYYYERYFKRNEIENILSSNGFTIEKVAPIDHIFTFVSFWSIFRNKNSYDGENELAVKTADFLSKYFPWQTASSTMIVAKKI